MTFPKIEPPSNSNQCAVVIPIYQEKLSDVERYCTEKTLTSLERRPVYFIAPEGLDSSNFESYGHEIISLDSEIFSSVESYSRWLLTPDLYRQFAAFEKLLICQTDAIVLRDDLDKWIDSSWDYIGAPWWGAVNYQPKTSRCHPELVGKSFPLQVGNGGLSLRNPRKMIHLLGKNHDFTDELLQGHGNQVNEDTILAILGIVDSSFRIPGSQEASKFSLELNARNTALASATLPMGFHALHKHDLNFFKFLFPNSPHHNR